MTVDTITFSTLRSANLMRLPLFKNKHGELAHSQVDGSDWSPAQWFQALLGELGEWATVRLQYEAGDISYEDYCTECAKELADVQTYLDILAARSLDKTAATPMALSLLNVTSYLGEFANVRKKLERGDYTAGEYRIRAVALIDDARAQLDDLDEADTHVDQAVPTGVHASGVNLGQATQDKWNEVSARVGVVLRIHNNQMVTQNWLNNQKPVEHQPV